MGDERLDRRQFLRLAGAGAIGTAREPDSKPIFEKWREQGKI